MKKVNRRIIKFLPLSMLAFGLSMLAVVAVMLRFYLPQEQTEFVQIACAIAIWVFLVIGLICVKLANNSFGRIRRKMQTEGKQLKQRHSGALTFSSEPLHRLIYAGCIVGVLVSIGDMIWEFMPPYVMYPILAVTGYLFILHCIVDGRNYKTYKLLKEGFRDGT